MLLLAECTPPNRYLIYVSRMLSLAECTPPNRYLIYVSRMLSLAECVSAKLLPDLRQPHDVAQSASWPNRCPIHVSRIVSFAECTSPNCCLIYGVIGRVSSPQPDPHHLRGCTKSVSRQCENESENEARRGMRDEGGSQIKTKSLI